MLNASFHSYERSEWETESFGAIIETEVSRRMHYLHLSFAELNLQSFQMVRHVNQTEFLDVDPGHLICCGVFVSTANPCHETDFEKIKTEIANWRWLLRFCFQEQSGRSWNQIDHPVDGGRAIRKDEGLCPAFNMTRYFGQSQFPLAASTVIRTDDSYREPPGPSMRQ
jgi:hypothetical protein